MNEPRLNLPELTVSELSMALKRTIEESYGYVRVRGELGKVSYHTNGHVYFDLKDDRASIAGVIWRNVTPRIKLKLEAGLEVVITGKLTTYPGRSQYQIIVETLEPAGIGALMALLEERKQKLAAEGLFDESRKQLLPFLPAVIGVVTSPTGARRRRVRPPKWRCRSAPSSWSTSIRLPGARSPRGSAIRRRGGANCVQRRARCRPPMTCWLCRGSGLTTPRRGCAADCAPTRISIVWSIRGSAAG